MAKVLNQQIYSSFVYGGEAASGTLRLESTASSTKGLVQIVGSALQIIVAGQVGQISHANTGSRSYILPDVSGEIFVSGRFAAANQIVYSSSASTFAVLTSNASSALVSNSSGALSWAASGTNGQVLTVVAGTPVFQDAPDNGFIANSPNGDSLPYYQTPGNDLSPLTTLAGRALLSTGSAGLVWALIQPSYLSAAGSTPLPNGVSGQILTSDGLGNFSWTTPPAYVVNTGTQFRIPFYSAVGSGQTLSQSSFLSVNETIRAIELQNQSRIRLYETTGNGSNYIDFRAPAAMSINTSFVLPGSDGSPGAVLQTDGFGNLSFVTLATGTVNAGLANQIAYYASAGSTLSGLPTSAGRALLSPGGALSWGLVTAPYLSTTGGIPLSNGTLNQVLTADGAGSFTWTSITSLTGQVLSGIANFLAYYPSNSAAVDDSSFLRINDAAALFEMLNGGQIRFYETSANGNNFIQFQSPANLTQNSSYMWPSVDGLTGYALKTDGLGNMSWAQTGRGDVNPGVTGSLAIYTGTTTDGFGIVDDFLNVPSRVLLTGAANDIQFNLITTEYLATTGGNPLDVGIPGEVLVSDGAGTFVWTDVASLAGTIQPGVAGYLTIYPVSGPSVNDSSYLQSDESSKILQLHSGGALRFFEPLDTNWVGLIAPVTASNVTFTLPAADGVDGAVLHTDGAGNLSFSEQVEPGQLNAIAFYTGTDRKVSPANSMQYTGAGLTLTGASFTIEGEAGAAPTEVILKGGDGVGVNGADVTLSSGLSDVADVGKLNLAAGMTTYASISQLSSQGYVNVENNAILRFIDGNALNSIGFKAAASITSDITFTLPISDGPIGSNLVTDGSGNLSFELGGKGIVSPSTVPFALPYYTGTLTPDGYGIVDEHPLILPMGLPADPLSSLVINNTTGQMIYAQIVQPNGAAGRIAMYSATQQVSSTPIDTLTFNGTSVSLELQNATGLTFYEASSSGTDNVRIAAPSSITSSYQLRLPPSGPSINGQVLTTDSSGNLYFATPGANPDFEKRGTIPIVFSTMEVSVVFESPFASQPASVFLQWLMTDGTVFGILPTYAIDQLNPEGFTARFSHPAPDGSYALSWQVLLVGETTTPTLRAFLAGGSSSGTPLNNIYAISLDTDMSAIVEPTTFTTARGYGSSSSSSTLGYLLGGNTGATSSSLIESFSYATSTVATLLSTLTVPRSSAGSLTTRAAGYTLGGETIGTGTLLSVEKLLHATGVVSSLPAVLSSDASPAATAQTNLVGYVLHSNMMSSMDVFTFATELVSAGAVSVGNTVAAGCNDTYGGRMYFASSNGGIVYSYNVITDTVAALTPALSSMTVVSSASNSLRKAYFTGASAVDSMEFSTETIALSINSLPTMGHDSASSPTFQTRGLL